MFKESFKELLKESLRESPDGLTPALSAVAMKAPVLSGVRSWIFISQSGSGSKSSGTRQRA